MTRKEYYIEALSSSFDEHGIDATPEQIRKVSEDLGYTIENESMAFGDFNIPNPLKAEIEELKKANKEEIERMELRLLTAQKFVADTVRKSMGRVDPNNIHINTDGIEHSSGRTTTIYE